MKIVIFSDVHGNIKALENLYKKEVDADLFIFLGDAVGYSPFGLDCFDFLNDSVKTIKIIGNHEEMFLKGEPHSSCSELAKLFFYASYSPFSEKQLISLNQWNEVYKYNQWNFKHTLENRHIYPNTNLDNNNLLENTFIGHSHIQFVRKIGNSYLVNPGSIGQNRKDKNIAQHAVLSSENNSVEFNSFFQSVDYIVEEMRVRKYNPSLINYYL
jgi:putative phosphoesterase